jgi:hypothetical protein
MKFGTFGGLQPLACVECKSAGGLHKNDCLWPGCLSAAVQNRRSILIGGISLTMS